MILLLIQFFIVFVTNFHLRACIEFTDIIHSNGCCDDSDSILMENQTMIISKCQQLLPLNSSIGTLRIIHLILKDNTINKINSSDLAYVKNVENIELINNNVGAMDNTTFVDLMGLKVIVIIEQDLTIDEMLLSEDCELNKIHVELKSFDNIMFSKLPVKVKNITIENTPAKNNEFTIPGHLNNLSHLRLKNCSIMRIKSPNFTPSPLVDLDLSYNLIKDDSLTFEKYCNLIRLKLSHNEISSLGEKTFQNQRSLEILQLDNNNIHFVHKNAFRHNVNLTKVYLSHNKLTRIRLHHKKSHNFLVVARFNPMSCEYLKKPPAYLDPDITNCIKDFWPMWKVILVCLLIFQIIIFTTFFFKPRVLNQNSNRSPSRPVLSLRSDKITDVDNINNVKHYFLIFPSVLLCTVLLYIIFNVN